MDNSALFQAAGFLSSGFVWGQGFPGDITAQLILSAVFHYFMGDKKISSQALHSHLADRLEPEFKFKSQKDWRDGKTDSEFQFLWMVLYDNFFIRIQNMILVIECFTWLFTHAFEQIKNPQVIVSTIILNYYPPYINH